MSQYNFNTFINVYSKLIHEHVVLPFFVHKVALAGGGMRLSDIVCNASLLGLYLTTEEGDSFPELQGALCSVPSDVMQKAEQIFLSQLDFSKILTVSGLMLSATSRTCTPKLNCVPSKGWT